MATQRGGSGAASKMDLYRRVPLDLTESTSLGGLLSICAT